MGSCRGSRFLQTDPVPGGSSNAYDYAGQNPVNNLDLSGRMLMGGADGSMVEVNMKGALSVAAALGAAAAAAKSHAARLGSAVAHGLSHAFSVTRSWVQRHPEKKYQFPKQDPPPKQWIAQTLVPWVPMEQIPNPLPPNPKKRWQKILLARLTALRAVHH